MKRCNPGLWLLHKVTEDHISLNPSLRMRVNLPVQVGALLKNNSWNTKIFFTLPWLVWQITNFWTLIWPVSVYKFPWIYWCTITLTIWVYWYKSPVHYSSVNSKLLVTFTCDFELINKSSQLSYFSPKL